VNKVAILIAMNIAEQLPLAEVKNRLSEVVEQVESQHARVTITKHGRPAAVIISAEDLESLEETLRVLSDPDLLAQVRASRAESDAAVTLDRNEALAMLGTGA
jgi:prevent-host-death family protein